MNSIFKICNAGNCKISIVGLEQDSSQYLEQRQVSIRNYTWEDTVSLNVIYKVDSKQEEVLESYDIVPHTDIDSLDVLLEKDGLYKVLHIIVPTYEWFQYVSERDLSHFENYSLTYFFNTTNETFYKISQGQVEEVPLAEIIEANLNDSNLISSERYTFGMCHINECFFKICKKLLENLPCECINTDNFKQDILNRDIIWMAINTINYLLQQENYFKAQNIIEQIDTCWGICGNLDSQLNKGGCNCGCIN